MKLTCLHIKNFRSCRDVSLEIGHMHALVGANNSGKSAVLRALDFLFNTERKVVEQGILLEQGHQLGSPRRSNLHQT